MFCYCCPGESLMLGSVGDMFGAGGLVSHQPTAMAQPASNMVRIFVEHSGSPKQIVMVNTHAEKMGEVMAAVAAKFGISDISDLRLELEGAGVAVNSPGEISANDKFVLVGGSAPPAYAN